MPRPFFPQLALFVASPAVLPLYREFVYPLVPSRTGLIPTGIEDIHASEAAVTPLAMDIALSRAAVVVYDASRRSRLSLEYVRARTEDNVVVVEAPPESTEEARSRDDPVTRPTEDGVPRPAEMAGWGGFVETLLARLAIYGQEPTRDEIARALEVRTAPGASRDLLLTALALLEHRVRRQGTAPRPGTRRVRDADSSDTGGMGHLETYFGADFPAVAEAISVRHTLLEPEHYAPVELDGDAPEVARVARAVAEVARGVLLTDAPRVPAGGGRRGPRRPSQRPASL